MKTTCPKYGVLATMMKKIDQEEIDNPLTAQNISVVEVGNYSHIFEKFIAFIGVKSLIITDIDSCELTEKEDGDKTHKKCRVDDKNATITSNASLDFFYSSNELTEFKQFELKKMVLKKDLSTKTWGKSETGSLLCIYQIAEMDSTGVLYHARSFEDAFFHLNREFIKDKKAGFKSLKNIKYFEDTAKDPYDLAEECVDKKPAFAIEVLLNSETDLRGNYFSNWQTPNYIKQGLLWLKID